MIVDDNDIDILIHEKIIAESAIAEETLSFNNAEKGLDYLSNIPNNDTTFPELIFLDINMPKINGFDFIIRYNKLNHPQKNICNFIVLSTYENSEQVDKLLKQPNILGCFPKPLSSTALKSIVNKLYNTKKAAH